MGRRVFIATLGSASAVPLAALVSRDVGGVTAVDLPDHLKKLLELYPNVDENELGEALMEAAKDAPALMESLDRITFDAILPIATKKAKGEPLTKMEKAICKLCEVKRRCASSSKVAS